MKSTTGVRERYHDREARLRARYLRTLSRLPVRALGTLLGSDRLAAVTVTEFNPYHGEEDGSTAEALADGLATALSGSLALGNTTATNS